VGVAGVVPAATLVLNGGSSSWKLAAYRALSPAAVPLQPALAETTIAWPGASASPGSDLRGALADACERLRSAGAPLGELAAVGHRIVHGGETFARSVRIDRGVEDALLALAPLAPTHNALEAAGIDAARSLFPGVPQIAAFDTAFHRTLPPEAFTYAGPYAWRERGIRRFGFHGLSVAYCVERAAQTLSIDRANLRLVVAHLGGGCSVTAVRDGASVDTTMGFTPLDGVMMGTRSGAVDPGILTYLLRERAASGRPATALVRELDDDLNHHSGLLGLSGISSDVRELEARARAGDARAELALETFAHRAACGIASMLPSLDRLDGLVFTGGIGEHAAGVRARICAKLRFARVAVEPATNETATGDVRIDASGPAVLVLQTREEWYVARECARVLARL
jgi:acetate kinase